MEYRYRVDNGDYTNAGKISSQIKQLLKQIGIPPELLRRMAVACYEAEINMIIHSFGGEVVLGIDEIGLISMVFRDCGPGIVDLDKAMQPGYSTASDKAREFGFGAGMGLPNIQRVSDHFHVETSPKGTTLSIAFDLS